MPRIRCHYIDCVFLDDNYCSAAAIELDPDTGCITFSPSANGASDEDWDDPDELDEWDELEDEEDEEDIWEDSDDTY